MPIPTPRRNSRDDRTSTAKGRTHLTLGLVIAAMLATSGCSRDPRPATAQGDHAGHVIPTHKPKSFPDAVRSLRALHEEIGRGPTGGATTPADETALSQALDIATWLPEIAAESDMPEKTWDKVAAISQALVANDRTLRRANGDRRASIQAAGSEIATLEAILAEADPRWFDKTVGLGGPP